MARSHFSLIFLIKIALSIELWTYPGAEYHDNDYLRILPRDWAWGLCILHLLEFRDFASSPLAVPGVSFSKISSDTEQTVSQ